MRTVAVLAVTAATVVLPAAASAAGSPHIRHATALDRCPGAASLCQDSQAVVTLKKGTIVKPICSTSGRGGTWYYLRAGGKTGFVPAVQVKRAGSVGSCVGNRAVTAALWATRTDVWNRTQPTAAMATKIKKVYGAKYDFGDSNDWSGDSRAFGALAYLANGKHYKLPLSNPIETLNNYKARGIVHTTGTPPTGALVFWHYKTTYGYEYGQLGISIGNRQTITTPGDDSQKQPVAQRSVSGNIGWVLPF